MHSSRLCFLAVVAAVSTAFAARPLLETNRGQFSPQVQFGIRSGGVLTSVTDTGLVFQNRADRIGVRFDGASVGTCVPDSPVESRSNYPALVPAVNDVPLYDSVVCRQIYPGIDWTLRTEGGVIEHDWRVAPGGDARALAIRVEDGSSAEVTSGGGLLLHSGGLSVVWKAPEAYQEIGGVRRRVASRYLVHGQRIAIQLGSYRRGLPLVIDPVIDFSYMVNGNADDRLYQVALDSAGAIYIAGFTKSPDFQTTAGAAFASPGSGGDYQVFVRKLSPDGSKTIYSTYLGQGKAYSDHPMGMRVDASGQVYLAVNAFGNGVDGRPIDIGGVAAVYKLSSDGTRLIYSTRLFPGYSYTEPVALAIDSAGNAYVALGSRNLSAAKIDAAGQHRLYLYETRVGDYEGGLADAAVGSDGSLYLAGTRACSELNGCGFPTTPGALNTSLVSPQNSHGYLMRLKPDGSGPIYGTYIAGQYVDTVSALTVDAAGAAYVGGQTSEDSQAPGLAGTALGSTTLPSNRAFIMKVAPDGSRSVFTALLPISSVNALAVDASGKVYSAGPDVRGLVVSKIDAEGKALLYHAAIPLPSPNQTLHSILGLAVDSSGAAYLAGSGSTYQVPDAAPSSRFSPNGFLLKINPDPDRCDLWIDAQSDAAYASGTPVHFLFTVHNNGPAAAQNVVLQARSGDERSFSSCRSSGTGVCSDELSRPRAAFDSIPPGGTGQIDLLLSTESVPASVHATAKVSTTTSDINQDNNSFTASSTAACAQLTVTAALRANFTVTGVTQAVGLRSLSTNGASYCAVPGSQVRIFVPSPQLTRSGISAVFQKWSDGSTDNPRTFTVASAGLSVSAQMGLASGPSLSAAGVTSSASYAGNGVSPGELVSVFGLNLGTASGGRIQDGRLTTALDDMSVEFDGYPAPLVATSSGQINAVAPYEISGRSSTTITVKHGSVSGKVTVPVVEAVPGLFTANASGKGQAAALNQDSSVNSAASPAKPGEVIVLYGTGEGMSDPVLPNGTILPYPAPTPRLPVNVTIGGQPAEVQYAAGAPGLVAGVIQINAKIPASGITGRKVPVTWSAGNHSSQDGVTIAVVQAPGHVPLFSPQPPNLSLTAIGLSPAMIAADSDATVVTVTGRNFESGMVVRWNGQPRPTQFLDSTRLQVTLGTGDLETPGLGSITVWNAAATQQVSASTVVMVYLALPNNDIVYDSQRQAIYAAVPAGQTPHASSIAVVDPATAQVNRWYPLEVEPSKLALSGDSRYLYVAMNNSVRRIDLNSWTADLDIPLGSDQSSGAREVCSMTPLPGENTSLAVSFCKTWLSPPYLGTAVFDGARMRPKVTPGHDGPQFLLGGPDAGTLYGADNGDLYTMRVDASGVTITGKAARILGADGDAVYSGGLVYGGWGAVVNPAVPAVVKTYDNAGLTLPLPDTQTTLILGNIPAPGYSGPSVALALNLYDSATAARLWSIPLPLQLSSNHGPMIRWGTDGVAVRGSQALCLFRVNLGR